MHKVPWVYSFKLFHKQDHMKYDNLGVVVAKVMAMVMVMVIVIALVILVVKLVMVMVMLRLSVMIMVILMFEKCLEISRIAQL